jgi:hypothetical protein
VTARAQPEIPNTASSSDEVSQPRFEEDEAITSSEEGPEIPTTNEIPQPVDREESNSTDVLQDPDQQRDSTSAIREQDLPTEAQEEDIATESASLPTETLDPPPSEAGTDNRENSISETVESDQRSHEQELHDLESDDPEHVARQLPPPTSRSSDPTGPSETRNGNPSGVPSLPTSPDASKETPKTAVRVFYPKHRTVDELAPEIEKHLTPGVGKLTATDNLVNQKARGVGPDTTRRKAIAVKDTPAALQQIAKMLEQSDVAPAPIQEPVADAEFTVDVTAIGVRIDPRQRRGVDLQELSSASGPYTLWAHPSDRVLKCAAGLPNDRNGRLKLAVFHGEEAPLLRDLRDMGPLQAVARSRVTMKSTEASRLVVEQETSGGRRDRARDHSIGVRPVLDAEGTVRLQVLPGTDEQGRPIEQAQQTPEPIGEVELRRGETAVIAGIMQVQPQSSRSRTASSRGRLANEGEVVEWIYLVTPHKQGSVKTSSRSTPARMSSPVAQRLREQRQTVSR